MRTLLLLVLLAFALPAPAPAAAQGRGRPLMTFGRQDLTFGALLPGVPTTVSRFDGLNAGQFELRGQRSAEVQVSLNLPGAMLSGGAGIPLDFGPADGGFSPDPDVTTSQTFDPRVPLVTTMATNGKLYLWLGGTALPGAQQAAGTYAAAITVTVAYTGN